MKKYLIEIEHRDRDMRIVIGYEDTLEAAVAHAQNNLDGMSNPEWDHAPIHIVELGEPVQVVVSTCAARQAAMAAQEREFYAEYENAPAVTVEETMQRR